VLSNQTMRRALLILVVLLPLASTTGGCKQGEGEVCQIDSDCESGLECNVSTHQCVREGGDGDGDGDGE